MIAERKAFQKIKTLELAETAIDDIGILFLSESNIIHKLETLDISMTKISSKDCGFYSK